MKAIIQTKYGPLDNLQFENIQKPVPNDDKVLVKIHASSINFNNLAIAKGEPFLVRLWSGLLMPKEKIPGGDVAGQIEAVGQNVKQLKPGDKVFGDICHCGFGAFAEYVCAPESAFVLKPANISFEEAATVPQSALVALQGLSNKGHIQSGQKVLIVGASGGIGTFAVQIAKSYGTLVTAVCSTRNMDMVRSIGADRVIDYTKEDFAENGEQYDLILATAGYRSIYDYKRALSPKGIYAMTGGSMKQIMQANILGPSVSEATGKKLVALSQKPSQDDLAFMNELIEAGKVKPVIDRRYPLSDVAKALQYYEEGHAQGKIVITMD
jgi:NADPH:quinone reductase-like Zn-dependent oxidoreductase